VCPAALPRETNSTDRINHALRRDGRFVIFVGLLLVQRNRCAKIFKSNIANWNASKWNLEHKDRDADTSSAFPKTNRERVITRARRVMTLLKV
jgi:hypothetical protein